MLNRNRREALKEGWVGICLIGGLITFVVGLFLMWLFAVAGVFRGTYTREPITNRITDAGTLNLVPVAFGITTIGLLSFLGALAYALWNSKQEKIGPRREDDNVKVIARYAYDRKHNLLTELWQIESADRPRTYVRLLHQRDGMIEYECPLEVYLAAGEGMWGTAEFQGKWLGKFTPRVGAPPAHNTDPYASLREDD